ncbi:MAG: hypothetical protein AAGU14_09595 [Eubacteriaceae bacterium]
MILPSNGAILGESMLRFSSGISSSTLSRTFLATFSSKSAFFITFFTSPAASSIFLTTPIPGTSLLCQVSSALYVSLSIPS